MGCRLPDLDHGLARQVRRLDSSDLTRDLRQNRGNILDDLPPQSRRQRFPQISRIHAHRFETFDREYEIAECLDLSSSGLLFPSAP